MYLCYLLLLLKLRDMNVPMNDLFLNLTKLFWSLKLTKELLCIN